MGAGTFSQLYIQLVFVVKGRRRLILPEWEDELFKYITGIVQNKGQKMLCINGVEDHIHFLISLKPSCSISDLVREIKKSTNTFIKDKKLSRYPFQWQSGYGAFSYSQSALKSVMSYIENQKEHHKKKSLKSEYKDLLDHFEIPYEDVYLFD